MENLGPNEWKQEMVAGFWLNLDCDRKTRRNNWHLLNFAQLQGLLTG